MMRTLRNRVIHACIIPVVILSIASLVYAQSREQRLIKDMEWRSIGPANMSGRVSDIEALDNDFATVLIASASGGVWKSTNAGTTFTPIFDRYGSASIGDVAFFQKDPDIIWVGTGEKNPRNSVAWGDGVYKSTDGGTSFTNMGLQDTHTIGKIITHPSDPDTIYVAAAGHTWGYIGDRGLFKTTDGGQNWRKLTTGLPNDGKTGAFDLVMDPEDPDILYVSFWQRLRQPYQFISGGPNGGIFKTINGGKSWKKLTKGLPEGDTGKIGLAISRKNSKVLMAIIEAKPSKDLSVPGSGIYRSEDSGETWQYVNTYNSRAYYYSHIYINPGNDQKVYVLTSSFLRSSDGGKTFIGVKEQRRIGNRLRGTHEDYHAMWFDPNNEDRYYLGSDGGVYLTHDDSKNTLFFDNFVISQFYGLGVDMRDPYWVYGGLQDNDVWGGPSRTRDVNIFNDHWHMIGPSQDGGHTQVDPTDWRTVYVGGQNGNLSRVNVETRQYVHIRPDQNNTVNFDEFITKDIMRQQRQRGWDSPFRFAWMSPFIISPHNPRTVYFGGNHLFKTVDRGDHWRLISPDLSKNEPMRTTRTMTSPESWSIMETGTGGVITTISESPMSPGLIWVGTDDGNVYLTCDDGATWKNVRSHVPGVPGSLWVSRIEASHFKKGTAYLAFDGHRSDNFQPWVFKTEDFGQTWSSISSSIPQVHCVYVIIEDLKNPDLLFAGTEFAVFYSLNRGITWTKLNNNLPTVAIHELVIHPRDNDLIAGTHGRGIWILDDITPLQQLTDEVLSTEAHIFASRPATKWLSIERGCDYYRGDFLFRGQNPPDGVVISNYIGSTPEKEIQLEIAEIAGYLKKSVSVPAETGIHRYLWDMKFDPTPFQHELFKTLQEIRQADSDEQRRQIISGVRSRLEKLIVIEKEKELFEQTLEQLAVISPRFLYRRDDRQQGFNADPGEYIVKMSVNGRVYSDTVTIRRDPILNKLQQ